MLLRLRSFRRFAADRTGVAGLEFAMIAPLMVVMLFGAAELGQGLTASRRVSHADAALGDLVAQASTVTTSDLSDCFSAATDILAPLPTGPLKMRVTSLTGDSNGNPKVDWSAGYGGLAPYTKNAAPPVSLPAGLITAQGDTIILSEAQYAYTSPIGYVLPSGLSFNRSAYLRPRKGTVTCPTC